MRDIEDATEREDGDGARETVRARTAGDVSRWKADI